MELTLILLWVALSALVVGVVLQCFAPRPYQDEPVAGESQVPLLVKEIGVPRWVYHYRNLLAAPPVFVAMVTFHAETEAGWLTWPLAFALVGLGVAIRVWAQAHIRFRLGLRRHLATTGPYAMVRNPLYLANTLICMGATAASEVLWLVPVSLVWCLCVYSLVIRQEEERLAGKYGEAYLAYVASVPRWVPRAWPLGGLRGAGRYVASALLVETPCVLVLLPFVVKEIISPWIEH